MARSGLRTDEMSGAKNPPQHGITRRKLAARFIAIASLVSSVALVAQPQPPEVTAPSDPIEVPAEQAPIAVPEQGEGQEQVLQNIPVSVTCNVQRRCTVNSGGVTSPVLLICRSSCSGATHTVTRGGTDLSGTELPVARGFRRTDPTTREIVIVEATEAAPAQYVRVEPDPNGDLIFESVGAADMTVTATYADAPTPAVRVADPDVPTVVIVMAGLLVLMGAGLGLFVLYSLIAAMLDAPKPSLRSVQDRDDEDVDEEEDLPVDAPLALAEPITKEVAEERAAVARDLLDRVRDIADPRHSIQTGFSLLETGFGRVHLARRRNETSTAYISRVFGDHEDLRPTMSQISQLFERARFSDMPVDDGMRASMIDGLVEVKTTWEKEAFLLADQVPAPPSVLSPVGHERLGGDD